MQPTAHVRIDLSPFRCSSAETLTNAGVFSSNWKRKHISTNPSLMSVKRCATAPGHLKRCECPMVRHLHECMDSGEGYFEHLLWIVAWWYFLCLLVPLRDYCSRRGGLRGSVMCACVWFGSCGFMEVVFLLFPGVLVSGVCAYISLSVVSVVCSDWCRIVESLCMGPLYSLWFFTRFCICTV